MFAAIGENGLNTTPNVSVFDLAALGPAACDAAEIDNAPAKPSTTAAAAPARGTFRMAPPSRLPGSAPCTVRHCVRTAPDHARRR